ncbi:MAG: transposase [Thermoproteus sp.]
MIVLLLHGSRDPRYLESVRAFAEALGLRYAFLEDFSPIHGAVYVPVFIASGGDYRRALRLSGSSIPPLARWPGFKEYLKGLGAAVYIFHGSRDVEYVEDVRSLGLPYVFLEGEPSIGPDACRGVGAPVVLTRGVIYDRIVSAWRSAGCRGELLPPLFEQEGFARYFSEALRSLIAPTGGGNP